MPDRPPHSDRPWSHYSTHGKGRTNRANRPLPVLVEQLRNRVAAGEDAGAVLDSLFIKRRCLRDAYLDRLTDA